MKFNSIKYNKQYELFTISKIRTKKRGKRSWKITIQFLNPINKNLKIKIELLDKTYLTNFTRIIIENYNPDFISC